MLIGEYLLFCGLLWMFVFLYMVLFSEVLFLCPDAGLISSCCSICILNVFLFIKWCEFSQMVDRLDDGAIEAAVGPLDYKGLYKV